MNPLYASDHSRWAPRSIVVVTRQEDIAAVEQIVTSRIREESHKRAREKYDADQLYLFPQGG